MLKKNKKTIIYVIFFIGFISVGIYFYSFNPATTLYPKCPFYYLTGYYCPGCGSSRAIHQLLHGNILGALDLNPLMVLLLPFVTYLVISSFNIVIFGIRVFPQIVYSRGFYITLLSVIIVYSIVRNLPIYPFNILAP